MHTCSQKDAYKWDMEWEEKSEYSHLRQERKSWSEKAEVGVGAKVVEKSKWMKKQEDKISELRGAEY